jgi:hypothetical protein
LNSCTFQEYLKSKRLEDSTIQFKIKIIRQLSKFNLWDSDTIREHIDKAQWGNRRKNNVSYAYLDWCVRARSG